MGGKHAMAIHSIMSKPAAADAMARFSKSLWPLKGRLFVLLCHQLLRALPLLLSLLTVWCHRLTDRQTDRQTAGWRMVGNIIAQKDSKSIRTDHWCAFRCICKLSYSRK